MSEQQLVGEIFSFLKNNPNTTRQALAANIRERGVSDAELEENIERLLAQGDIEYSVERKLVTSSGEEADDE